MANYPDHQARYRGGNEDFGTRRTLHPVKPHYPHARDLDVQTMELQHRDYPDPPPLDFERVVGGTRCLTQQQLDLVDAASARVREELLAAMIMHGPMHSGHEAYGVIKEELDEFFDEVRANKRENFDKELKQVAAMAIRAMVEVA